jgi:uncharacterized protein (UPF0548 family)
MDVSGMAVGRRTDDELDRILRRAQDASPTYDHVGSTLGDVVPPRVQDRRFERLVDGTIAQARAALERWSPHDGIRARIVPEGAAPSVDLTVVVVAPFGPLEMAVPDRVVAVVDEADRVGFAYGTLPGHAETGEELFLAEAVAPGRLRLIVRVHARPATTLARLGTPVVVLFQRLAARRYLAAWAEAIQAEAI